MTKAKSSVIDSDHEIEEFLQEYIVEKVKSGYEASTTIIRDKEIKTQEINFNELIKSNNEIKGWIKVNNTNINYPFVQSSDNEFYLSHDLYKKYNSAGWIFADYRNNLENLDKNTIIYGHNRLNNSMFAELEKTLNPEWYKNEDNKYILFNTKHNNYVAEIVSIYKVKAEDFIASNNFSGDEFLNYIDKIKSKSIYDFETDIDVSDKIITLYTCDKTSKNRIIIHAKLIEY